MTHPPTPPPRLAAARSAEPLTPHALPSGDPVTLATRHADVQRVLADPRFTREVYRYPHAPRLLSGGSNISNNPDSLLNMDPPRHSRLRRIVAGAFLPRQAETWRPRVREVAGRLVDELASAGPGADLIAGFAFPLPIQVICELLGVPAEDHDLFRGWAGLALTASPESGERRAKARVEFTTYVLDLLAARRRDPGDALIDLMISAHDGADVLTERELISLIKNLITAGHETTTNVLSSGMFTLLSLPGAYAAVVGDPALVPPTVEEVLRHDMPGEIALPRLATRDLELPGGPVREGESVLPALAAANRDSDVFPDPDRFDITRTENRHHVSFGHGPHYCIGANLARMELQVALEVLTERLPRLSLACAPEEIIWTSGGMVRGPRRLPVRW
jgi:cytochrome P450